MTAQLGDIRRLLPVLDAAFQAEQTRMSGIMARIRELKTMLADLDNPTSFDPMSTASRLGADLRWEAWVQDRKDLILRELALAHRAREDARQTMAAALSRLQAAQQVERRTAARARQQAARRASW